jgi:hypothetical protein
MEWTGNNVVVISYVASSAMAPAENAENSFFSFSPESEKDKKKKGNKLKTHSEIIHFC